MSETAGSQGSLKQTLITWYLLIGLGVAVYKTFFTYSTHGFFYNLGMGIVWPAVLFPALGKVIGAVILIAVIVAILAMR